MAVVQISRIQIRRGQKNQGVGLPQLASGELGWAIDTRELYIGNGSVSEGAPAVGNTKVLTQYDDIFSLADTYTYRVDDAYIQTGATSVSPVRRTLQNRLDDRVSVRAFGITGVASQNATALIQRALDQLYLNDANKGNEQSRVILYFEPGVYAIDDTLYIPPFATLMGAGPEKTIIRQTGNATIMQTINDSSTPGAPADDSSSTFNNQARKININNMTLQHTQSNIGLNLKSCRESIFENIDIVGSWTSGDSIPVGFDSDIGIQIDSLSGSVESSGNKFLNCKVANWAYGIMSNWDVDYNIFDKCTFQELGYGINFGVNMILDGDIALGRSQGPSYSIISNCNFYEIDRYGLWIENGKYNFSKNNIYRSVGNEGGTEGQPIYSVIKFNKVENQSIGDYFSRTENLSYNQEYILTVPYVPEIEGIIDFTSGFSHILTFTQTSSVSGVRLFRLPGFANQTFIIEYQMMSQNYEMQRIGTLTITTEIRATPTVNITEEYDFVGDTTYEDNVSFTAGFDDEDGDAIKDTVYVNVVSSMPSDDTTEFKFKVIGRKTNLA